MQDLQSSDLNNCFVPNGEPLKRCSTLKFNANCEMIFRTWEIQYIKNEEGKKMFSNAVELLNRKKKQVVARLMSEVQHVARGRRR